MITSSVVSLFISLSLFSLFQQNSDLNLDENKLTGRLKEYFLDQKVLNENPDIKKISQILNISTIKTRFTKPNNPEIFLEMLKPLEESEKTVFRSSLNENALVYILGNYKGGLLDSKRTAEFLKQAEIIFLDPSWKSVNQSDKFKLIKNVKEIISKPEMIPLKAELENNSIDLSKLNINEDGIFVYSTKLDVSSPEATKLKEILKEILQKASLNAKNSFENKNLKDFITLKEVSLLPIQNITPESSSLEKIKNNILEFFNDPSNKDLISGLEKLNADPTRINFNGNNIVIPLRKNNSANDNDMVKALVRDGLDFFVGNYRGGAGPESKSFISMLNILIEEPNPISQNLSNLEWSQVTFMQPILSFYSQGCFFRKKHVPVIFFVPINSWVLVQKGNNYPIHGQQTTVKILPTITADIPLNLDAESAFYFGKNAYQSGDLLNALEYFDHSISKAPNNSIAWHYRAIVLLDLGQNEKSQYSAKKAGSLFLTEKDHDQTLGKLERIQGFHRKFLVENRNSLQKDEIVYLVQSELPPEILERKNKIELAINNNGNPK